MLTNKIINHTIRRIRYKKDHNTMMNMKLIETLSQLTEVTGINNSSSTQSSIQESTMERLYSLSREKQEEGKKRREAIALASLKRNKPSDVEYGVLPSHNAHNMYLQGIAFLYAKEKYIQQCRAKKQREEESQRGHASKLAEGAFALCSDPSFQERVFQKRRFPKQYIRSDA